MRAAVKYCIVVSIYIFFLFLNLILKRVTRKYMVVCLIEGGGVVVTLLSIEIFFFFFCISQSYS